MRSFDNAKPDLGLVGIGVLISTVFVSTDGNGQNLFYVALAMLLVAFVACIVSFSIARIVRTLPLAVIATFIITDLLFVMYFMYRVALREPTDRHVAEEAFLLPIVFTIVTAPLVALSALGFGRIANRYFHSHRGQAKGQADPVH